MFIESLLDIGPGGDKVDLAPVLPPMFNRISLRNLRIGARRVDVNVTRNGDEVDADVVEEPIPSVPATA
jgi:hypothetical protein